MERDALLDGIQFRSDCQEFRFAGKLAWILGVECDPRQIVSYAQPHQIVACELLAGQAIARFLIHLPRPRQILVRDPRFAEQERFAVATLRVEHFAQRGFGFFPLPSLVHACAEPVEVPALRQAGANRWCGATMQNVKRYLKQGRINYVQ